MRGAQCHAEFSSSLRGTTTEVGAPHIVVSSSVNRAPNSDGVYLIGFKGAATCDEPLVGNPDTHKVPLGIDCPHEVVDDCVDSLLSREAGTRRAVWRAILLDRHFVCS